MVVAVCVCASEMVPVLFVYLMQNTVKDRGGKAFGN